MSSSDEMRRELNSALVILRTTTVDSQNFKLNTADLAVAGAQLTTPLMNRCLWLMVGGDQILNLTQRISALTRQHQLFC